MPAAPPPHQPRKALGQHFLHDPAVVARILTAVAPEPAQRVLEIGPGQGALTTPLAASGARVTLLELDATLAERLAEQYAGHPRVHVQRGDATRADLAPLANGTHSLRVVGNLPYNVSTPVLFNLLGQVRWIRELHLMLQREVVNRMAAAPGSRVYGRLSVMTQLRCRVEPLFQVGAGAFTPPPRVVSTMVRLTPHPQPPVDIPDEALFAEVVRRAFGQRRKTLRNALKGLVSPEAMVAAGVDPGARPETLSLDAFAALTAHARRS